MDEAEAEQLFEYVRDAERLDADEYEELTATILESKLRRLPEAHTVTHDHDLECDFGEKQMDVFLQAGEGDDEVTAIVECKGSGYPMEKDDLACFAFYLEHSDADKGIYVARSGYRSGAKEIAEMCGIQLLEIQRIENASPKHVVGEFTHHFGPYRHDIRVTQSEPEDWVNLSTVVYNIEDQLSLPILDETGDPTGETIGDRLQESTEDGGTKVTTEFNGGEKVKVDGEG